MLGLVTVNPACGRGELMLYPADIAVGIALLSFPAAGTAVPISLRSLAACQAQRAIIGSLAIARARLQSARPLLD